MEIWVVLLFIFFSLKALSQDTSEWLSIDCGSSTSYKTSGILWQTDDKFIKTGTNKQVSPNMFTTWEQMNSLRVFTQQNKNCYTLPSNSIDRYFIRTTFKYGNYDGLSNAPTFDLQIDGNKMLSIKTSVTDIVYAEVIYTSRGDNISVCLSRIRDKEYPFISSLEAWPLGDNMYIGMNRDLAWVMSYRYNYGTEDWINGYPGDKYNRVWEPAPPQGLVPLVADTTTLHYIAYEDPPHSAIFDAVEAPTPTDSIILSFPISKTNSVDYILMYFTEMTMLINETRAFDIYVDNVYVLDAIPEYENCSKGKSYAQPRGTLSVELRPKTVSTLPPIISAIEVYTASDALVTIGTSQDDLDGLGVIMRTFLEQLKGWSGEPCLPIDTTWQWLGCAGNDPPRVTSLNLSGYNLDGPLPDFSQMQGLESIDLSNNSLDGLIPDFLGKLPNLKLLDLRRNNFYGEIPRSITSNKKIKYRMEENSHRKGKKLGLIIGLAVGLLVGILVITIVAYLLYLKRTQTIEEQTPTPEPESELKPKPEPESESKPKPELGVQENPQEEVSVSINASTELMVLGSQQNETIKPKPEGENVRVEDINGGNANKPFEGNGKNEQISNGEYVPLHVGAGEASGDASMVPDMDMDELDELVQQYENQNANRRA